MSVKKTSSPLSGGAEAIDPLGGKDELQSGRIEKNFETALAELAGQVGQSQESEPASSPTRLAFQQIAAGANLDSPEGAMSAVRESAEILVNSSLGENVRNSDQGRKITEDLSGYISRDPLMHRKILDILQRLK